MFGALPDLRRYDDGLRASNHFDFSLALAVWNVNDEMPSCHHLPPDADAANFGDDQQIRQPVRLVADKPNLYRVRGRVNLKSRVVADPTVFPQPLG